MQNKIPDYINEKSNIVRLVLLTAVFALVFINIYKPFSAYSWYNVSEFKFFLFSSLIILTGVLVVVFSRFLMYLYTRKKDLLLWEYLVWIAAEIFFMSVFYTLYTKSLNPDRELIRVFKESTINTGLVLLLPYSVLWLYFSWRDKKDQLERILQEDSGSEEPSDILSFYDEKGELRLSLKKENFLYLSSADNYVIIWYMNKGKLSSFMLRNSLKNMEKQLEAQTIVRCHRSHMVNFERIKVLRKEKEGIFLEFDIEQAPDLPISKTYAEKVTALFLKQDCISHRTSFLRNNSD